MLIRIIAISASVGAILTCQQVFDLSWYSGTAVGILVFLLVRAGAWGLRAASRQLVARRAKRRSKFNVADIALLIS